MTALFDQPNLPAADIRDMLAMAMPKLKLQWESWGRGLKTRTTFRTSFKKYNNELFVFFNYYPNATPSNRWSVAHEGKIGSPWRDVDFFKKRVSKRFASLIDAITYYETEIKR
jgi:hypothetical protein